MGTLVEEDANLGELCMCHGDARRTSDLEGGNILGLRVLIGSYWDNKVRILETFNNPQF